MASATFSVGTAPSRASADRVGDHDVAAVDLEEVAQRLAVVRAAEAVGAEHRVAPVADPLADLVGEGAHVVRRRDHRPGRAVGQALLDPREPRRLGGVEHVPAGDVDAVAAQLGEARRAPHVGDDAPVVLEHLGGGDHLAQDRPRAHELRAASAWRGSSAAPARRPAPLPEQVETLDDPLLDALGHRRVVVVLVHQGQVVEDVLLLGVHPPQPVRDDHRDLVGEGRVVGHAVGDHRREQVRVPVLVLQALAVERRAPGGAAEQEPAGAQVAGGPGEVADALEPEHRVVDVERDHRDVAGGVRRGRGDPRRHRAQLVDALLQQLAVLVLLVEHQLAGVLGRVELPDPGEDPELAEHALHAERARLVRARSARRACRSSCPAAAC